MKGKFLRFRIASTTATSRHVPLGVERRVYRAKEVLIEGTRPAAMVRPAARMLAITERRTVAILVYNRC